MESVYDQKLIDGCRKGDRMAQKRLFELLSPKMYPLCIRYVGSGDVAKDVLQDGFVTLFSKIGSYRGEGAFEGWARKIFVNESLMYLRRNDALKLSEDLETVSGLSSGSSSQVEDIGYKELLAMIASLPPGFRTVFNLAVIEGMNHKDIGEALGISEVTSRSQLSRARLMLQKMIKERK
ncbi:MAG: RNA polymerase sigma factor [Bacteroidales bacterium]|nr:RNA polymerase sigma factor [Bacteroidales bacterium]